MAQDPGTTLMLDLMSRSTTVRERVVVMDTALRNAGVLEVPRGGPSLRHFVVGAFRRAAAEVLGEERGLAVMTEVVDFIERESHADTLPPAKGGAGATLHRMSATRDQTPTGAPVSQGKRRKAKTLGYDVREPDDNP